MLYYNQREGNFPSRKYQPLEVIMRDYYIVTEIFSVDGVEEMATRGKIITNTSGEKALERFIELFPHLPIKALYLVKRNSIKEMRLPKKYKNYLPII